MNEVKFTIRIPEEIHKELVTVVKNLPIRKSINSFIVEAINKQIKKTTKTKLLFK